ncbi:hypothetical protein DFH28DRAFT_1200924 [Melampsora americana]|nr:hypothetical protein DFH28DRAFT_1200924 [Melampsora americana]
MNIFTSNIPRILSIVLPVFLVHLNQSYSAPSFKPHEILEAHSEVLEGHPELLKGPSQGSDELKFTGGESHTSLPMEETIVQDHLENNYKPQESAFSQTWKFLSMENKRSAKEWSRIYDVGDILYPSQSLHLKGMIETVLKIGRHNRPPSSESIGRDLIVPTFLALQDHSLTMLERMWAVGVLSYGKTFDLVTLVHQDLDLSHPWITPTYHSLHEAMNRESLIYHIKQQSSDPSKHTSLEFERLLHSFINLQIPTKLKDVTSLEKKILNSLYKGNTLEENPSINPLEKHYLRQMQLHLTVHHEHYSWKTHCPAGFCPQDSLDLGPTGPQCLALWLAQ